jgi:hypothetical protein
MCDKINTVGRLQNLMAQVYLGVVSVSMPYDINTMICDGIDQTIKQSKTKHTKTDTVR